jgi:hypothetical protein
LSPARRPSRLPDQSRFLTHQQAHQQAIAGEYQQKP